jgi:mannose-6-phosphate isomerase-like protein (cupin superfamily)
MPVPPDPTAPHWSPALVAELAGAARNGRVGSELVSETDEYRVWLIAIDPGARLPFHTHVLNYFWVATSDGAARSRRPDGSVTEMTYHRGQCMHLRYGAGESMTHDLENIGPTPLTFTTVEDLRSPNPPLPL